MMQKITKTALMSLRFPLPSTKNEQTDLVRTLTDTRAAAAGLRRKAKEERAKAWSNFEAAVYEAENNASAPKV